jgi:peptidoglycan/LPS O-acetylase OafA/YrhL
MSSRSTESSPTVADYRADVDGLRAVAVISVMLYHLNATWLPGGFVGVDIFFVISGFVVSASLAHAPRDRFHRFVAFFYARRLARIGPALVLVLIASALAATLVIPRAWLSEFNERTALFAFVGLSNWILQSNADTYFAPRAEFNPYTHTWSLGVEEQFYLVFPFLFFAWVKLHEHTPGRRVATALFALLGIASLAACIYATTHAPATAFYSIFCRFWELAVGCLLYQCSAWPGLLERQHRTVVFSILPWLGAVAITVTFAYSDASAFPWFWAVPPVLGAACLIGGDRANTNHPLRRLLAHPLVTWIGKRSYSLYLWHWPVFVVLRWTIGIDDALTRTLGLTLSFALAAISYRWVELPIRHSSSLLRRPAIVRIAILLVMIAAGWWLTAKIFVKHSSLSLSTVSRNAEEWYVGRQMPAKLLFATEHPRRCEVTLAYRFVAGGQVISYLPTKCSEGAALSSRQLSVVGDSHATSYMPMFDKLSAETGIRVVVYTFPGCGYLDLRLPMNVGRGPGCSEFARAATLDIAGTAKSGDAVLLASLRLPRFADQWASFVESEVLAAAQSDLAKKWLQDARAEAAQLLQPLFNAGIVVLFDAPKPVFKSPAFRCADTFNALNPICRGGLQQPREALEKLRAPVVENLRVLAAQFPQVRLWDPFPALCPSETCDAMDSGHPLFFDGDHLSAYGNAKLYPEFRDLIVRTISATTHTK